MIDWNNADDRSIITLAFLFTSLANERLTSQDTKKIGTLVERIRETLEDLEHRPSAGLTFGFGPERKP